MPLHSLAEVKRIGYLRESIHPHVQEGNNL